jgi:hypothetical protein
MLEFCVDLSLYLINNPEGTAAIHCKAGKGRTGVMICCFLIFSGICKNAVEALKEYGDRRSHLKKVKLLYFKILKGVTIPSQRRYVHHFETFLSINFEWPYYKMIPKMIKTNVTFSKNLLVNMLNDKVYYDYVNLFKLKKIKIGPFTDKHFLNCKLTNFRNHIKFDSSNKLESTNFKYSIKEEYSGGKLVNYSTFVKD